MAGAKVYALAAGTGAPGTASVSTHAWNLHHDAIGHYSVTKADGSFDVPLRKCRAGEYVYVVGRGGSLQNQQRNDAREEMAIVGACPQKNEVDLVVNDLTTVASVYALGGFMKDSVHVASGGSAVGLVGRANAFAAFPNIVDKGIARAKPESNELGTVPQGRMDLLANLLVPCSMSDGKADACSALLSETGAKAGGTMVDAVLQMNRAPGRNVDKIVMLKSATDIYTPADAKADDFVLAVKYSSKNMSAPAILAIDSQGNVWIPNLAGASGGSLTKLSPLGRVLIREDGITGGDLNTPVAVAIDKDDNVWVANEQGAVGLSRFDKEGTPRLPPGGFHAPVFGGALALAKDGRMWMLTIDGHLAGFDASGAKAKCAPQLAKRGVDDFGLAFTPDGTLWAVDYLGADVGNQGVLDKINTETCEVKALTGNALAGPQFVATTKDGRVWVANDSGKVLSVFSADGSPITTVTDATMGKGGLNGPNGILVDGDGVIWTVNFTGFTVSNFTSDGKAISPENTGLARQYFSYPPGLAIDPSGNVWVSNYGYVPSGTSVVELLGAAAPVVTPLNPATVGQRPQ